MSRTPYKFLDYYSYEDKDLFFGREEETRKMVGEILSTRLLVLFSPSGSGKTSLINAGVRPQLEEMGYKTVYTRLEDTPIPSLCKAVSRSLDLQSCQENQDLYEFMKDAALKAGNPVVIFLDQFEEFFIVYNKEERQAFVDQIARIKFDDSVPVFLVLSLREDYYGNLHEFREVIPSIFQNNANIRLAPFDEKEAPKTLEDEEGDDPNINKELEGLHKKLDALEILVKQRTGLIYNITKQIRGKGLGTKSNESVIADEQIGEVRSLLSRLSNF